MRQRERVGLRGGDQESEIEGESETERERCCRREKERCCERERERERDERREDPINGGPATKEQEATSCSGSSTGGRMCNFWWPEPIFGETVKVRQFLWSSDHIWSGDLVLSAFWFNRRW